MPATPPVAAAAAGWRLENSYASLPPIFHVAQAPVPVRTPRLVIVNRSLAAELGLDPAALDDSSAAAIFAGNAIPPGSQPLAQAYAGHQFGGFTTLGDGRAILLGEQITPAGHRLDIQLKGSGRTSFSRGGDGRAPLAAMLREYLVSEAMHALGIPTTRSLAVAATGESVMRQDGPLPGAVLTRVAASHIRVGTFEWAAATGDPATLAALLAYTLNRHFPHLADAENPALALLDAAAARQAELIARWMAVGFIHGVMNTDNMAISGETIDYGPCAFMDAYDPATVFSSIDRRGRYAYANQPTIAHWNLARLAETLLPLIHPTENQAIDLATAVLTRFPELYESCWLAEMRRKLGLFTSEPDDPSLVASLLAWMHESTADFTNTFAALASADLPHTGPRDWSEKWHARLARQPQSRADSTTLRRSHNPAVIPRNHLVEAALAAAVQDNLAPFQDLLQILATPYNHHPPAPAPDHYRSPAPTNPDYQTFCGT